MFGLQMGCNSLYRYLDYRWTGFSSLLRRDYMFGLQTGCNSLYRYLDYRQTAKVYTDIWTTDRLQ